jgi:metallophosphoesterase (TIGR00282 family)
MKILYVGDVMGRPGVEVVQKVLPKLRREVKADLVVAQAENVTDGRGMSVADYQALRKVGVDFFTGGNWTLHLPELHPLVADPQAPVIRPANYPKGTTGLGYKYIQTPKGRVLVVSLLGLIVGKDADKPVDNPLKVIDAILEKEKDSEKVATVVNFHGDYSSEKRIIGYYLDGRVSLVVGDHWHIPTADADVLPKGTAVITDVGMCGSLDSSLGVTLESVVPRWRDGKRTRNIMETKGRMQFCAVLAEIDEKTGLAQKIQHIHLVLAKSAL